MLPWLYDQGPFGLVVFDQSPDKEKVKVEAEAVQPIDTTQSKATAASFGNRVLLVSLSFRIVSPPSAETDPGPRSDVPAILLPLHELCRYPPSY